ncbi:MAG: hypothetical protein A2W31_01680 [Planctomycetes bacterium RBG_16_64_10]|nr:MAG: hypothetical protein A2W31_01680 [Planctomycetes bacterium RBG_16_64_10]
MELQLVRSLSGSSKLQHFILYRVGESIPWFFLSTAARSKAISWFVEMIASPGWKRYHNMP